MARSEVARRFNLHVLGAGEPTLVFAHGFGSDQTAWRHQVDAFVGEHRIVLFDHLGCGKADVSDYHPRRYATLDQYAADLLTIYEALELRDTVYIGHSAAAMIGMLACLAEPAYFAKLVFVGGSARYLDDEGYVGGFTHEDLNTLYAVMASDYLAWANGFGPVVIGDDDRPELGREFASTLATMRPDIAQSAARVIFESDFRSHLPHIQAPVLVLQTRGDLIVPLSTAEYMASHMPGARLELLDAVGHVPQLSAPAAVTNAIRRFIAA